MSVGTRCRSRWKTFTIGTPPRPTSSSPLFPGHADRAASNRRPPGRTGAGILGDSITTDHISPAGSIAPDSPAGRYLQEHGIVAEDFNSYGSRRGNHELMMRGTFANVRLKNFMAPGTEGAVTRHLPGGEVMSIFDAARELRPRRCSLGCPRRQGVWLGVVAATGPPRGRSSWASRGASPRASSDIHRSNLVGMGVLPLQFDAGDNASTLGLTGEELYRLEGLADALFGHAPQRKNQREGPPA